MPLYPPPPGPRLGWDQFAAMVQINDTKDAILGEIDSAGKAFIADNNNSYYSSGYGDGFGIILLPEPYDLDGYFLSADQINTTLGPPAWSTDTTNGLDGTWTEFTGQGFASQAPTYGQIRANTITESAVNVVGIRWFANNGRFPDAHLYGRKSTLSGLMIWDDTLDQAFDHANFDTADTADAAVNDMTFRIKNLDGGAKTNVTLSIEQRKPNAGFDDMHTVDYNGGGFGAFPVNIGTLNAGQISDVFTIRQTIDDTTLGPAWARIKVAAD